MLQVLSYCVAKMRSLAIGKFIVKLQTVFKQATVYSYYIITNNINCFLIGLRCIPNTTHTNHSSTNLANASKHIKNYKLYHQLVQKLM